nr:flavoprotein [Actinoplanes solisilvae]
MPATANLLAAAATGAVPNLLAGVLLAATVPVVLFPMMSPTMLAKPAVARNLDQLRQDGCHVVEPIWEEQYNPATRAMVKAPSLPSPATVVSTIKEILG